MGIFAINHNLVAERTQNALSAHYGDLARSTQRLSSGLRINSAADDAAGLAIRELMRSEITSLRQGMRNVNDGISMLQTMDGALSIIDEKLIRMKELAEQAATGTYDSTQRLMIDSEFQAMGAEIDRIARATDFNGMKLLDGQNLGNRTKIARSLVSSDPNDPNAPHYDVEASTTGMVNRISGTTASQIGDWDTSQVTSPQDLPASLTISLNNSSVAKIDGNYLVFSENGSPFPDGSSLNLKWTYVSLPGMGPNGTALEMAAWEINGAVAGSPGVTITGSLSGFTYSGPDLNGNNIDISASLVDANGSQAFLSSSGNMNFTNHTSPSYSSSKGNVAISKDQNDPDIIIMDIDINGDGKNVVSGRFNTGGDSQSLASVSLNITSREIKKDNDPPDEDDKEMNYYDPLKSNYIIPSDVIRIHFGSGADRKEDFYDINRYDATLKGLGLDQTSARTQNAAQEALVSIRDAIIVKDMIRAEYGAMQNRLENTFSSLSIQAGALQASESRISDAEIASEMMNFVRSQILSDTATAMLAQANSFPQMVLSLVRGE